MTHQSVGSASARGAARREYTVVLPRAATKRWCAAGAPAGRSPLGPWPRCALCQWDRPLPAGRALPRTKGRTLMRHMMGDAALYPVRLRTYPQPASSANFADEPSRAFARQQPHHRRHVRRRRFVGGRAAAQAARPSRVRAVHEKLGRRRWRALLHRQARPGRRNQGVREDRHRTAHGQLRCRVLGRRVQRLPPGVRGRTHAESGRALQPGNQVQAVRPLRRSARRGSNRHRALRPHRHARRASQAP